MNRRDALKTIPVLATAISAHAEPPGLTVRMSEPANLEPAFSEQKAFITPTEQFFVRSHFAVPTIDLKTYALEVSGAVETPLKLTLDDLKAMPAASMPLTLECAGNGRVFLAPAVRGLQWQFGAVGTATWGGVPLAAILEKAGAKKSAVEVILVGADKGAITSDPPSAGAIHFDRSIPIEKARAPETLLAYSMNGEPLTQAHGAPLRAVVGGWYGMAAVKWLTKIIVTDTPYDGFWQTFDYAHWERRDGGLATLKPVTAMLPKAQIARPAIGEIIPTGQAYAVQGYAWAGEENVAKVEISTDGGATWSEAKLTGESKPFCWRSWEFAWTAPVQAGPAKLLVRCYDAKGRSQPEKRDPDRRTYEINHLVSVEVMIRAAGRMP